MTQRQAERVKRYLAEYWALTRRPLVDEVDWIGLIYGCSREKATYLIARARAWRPGRRYGRRHRRVEA